MKLAAIVSLVATAIILWDCYWIDFATKPDTPTRNLQIGIIAMVVPQAFLVIWLFTKIY